MSAVNDTNFNSAVFLLTGQPGWEDVHLWISIPFCLVYVILIVGNSVILFIIKTDPTLHEPMYIFLSMLAITDLGILITIIPRILGTYLFNSREISLDACFAQLFFIHSLSFIESSILLLMAFDRFVVNSNPLRYASILTLLKIAKMGLVFVLRGFVLTFPLPLSLEAVPILSSQCPLPFLLPEPGGQISCSDIAINSIYDLFITLLIVGLNSLLFFLSYVMILKTVLKVASHTECRRALNTCVSHLCAVALFYTPEIGLSLLHRFGKGSPPLLQILLANIYLLVPPLMNQIVYSIKGKHLHASTIRVFVK